MFEDSTFESTGRIKTRSRRWMIATSTINGSILLALILIPLVFPNALPQQVMPYLMVAPAAPTSPPAQAVRQQPHANRDLSEISDGHIVVPSRIPAVIRMMNEPEAPFASSALTMEQGPGVPGGGENPFGGRRAVAVVHPDNTGPVRVSSMIVSGLLIHKTIPEYPPIPRAMRVEGTVVLQATISKMGTIENLRVVSGPAMLQQAALDAVKTWRYRPYLLNDQPVEVETTVNVVFSISR
jgi:protein TonB